MKENFYLQPNLNLLKEQMENHQPYAVMIINTTGLGENDVPIKIELRQFEYDEEKKQYFNPDVVDFDTTCGMSYNAVLKISDDLLNERIELLNESEYNIFKNAGINVDEYKSGVVDGNSVLSTNDFQKAFENIVNSLEVENTLLIVNGLENAEKALAKVGCNLDAFKTNQKIIDQNALSVEYIGKKEGIEPKGITLKNLADIVDPLPSSIVQKFSDEQIQKDYSVMNKQDFLSAHTEIPKTAYELYDKRQEFVSTEKMNIMNKMITKFGIEENILPNMMKQMQINNAEKQKQALSENGKKMFANSSVSRKLEYFAKNGLINADDIKNRTGEFEKIGKALTKFEPEKNKVCFLHLATTDREEGNMPLRLQAKVYNIAKTQEGIMTVVLKKPVAEIDQIIPSLSTRTLNSMSENKEQIGFNDAHLPIDKFIQGLDGEGNPLPNREDAIRNISEFFNTEMLKECNIVVAGGEDFYKKSLSQFATFDLCNENFINALKAVQEYTYAKKEGMFKTEFKDNFPKYPCFDEIQGFRLPDLAQSLKNYSQKFDIEKIDLAMKLDIVATVTQALGCEYSFEYLDEVKERNSQPKKNTSEKNDIKEEIQTNNETPNETPIKEEIETKPSVNNFIEEDEEGFDYDDIETVTDSDIEKAEQKIDDYEFEEIEDEEMGMSDIDVNQITEEIINNEMENSSNTFFKDNNNNNLKTFAKSIEKVAEENKEKTTEKTDKSVKDEKDEKPVEDKKPNKERMIGRKGHGINKISKEKAENLIPEPKSEQIEKSNNEIIAQLIETNNRLMTMCNSLTEQNSKLTEQNNRLTENLMAVVQQNSLQSEKIAELANGILNATREQNSLAKGMIFASNPDIASTLKDVMDMKKDDEPSLD